MSKAEDLWRGSGPTTTLQARPKLVLRSKVMLSTS